MIGIVSRSICWIIAPANGRNLVPSHGLRCLVIAWAKDLLGWFDPWKGGRILRPMIWPGWDSGENNKKVTAITIYLVAFSDGPK